MYKTLNLHYNTVSSCVVSSIMKQDDFQLGEITLCPPKIVITNKIKLHLVFLGTCVHHILIIFVHFKYIALTSDLNYFINSNKHLQTWTYEVYLC